jgi:hypothetical protein
MKFRLHDNVTELQVREIGNHLRLHGSGKHWLERFRGQKFLFASDQRDQEILLDEFSGLMDPVPEMKES